MDKPIKQQTLDELEATRGYVVIGSIVFPMLWLRLTGLVSDVR